MSLSNEASNGDKSNDPSSDMVQMKYWAAIQGGPNKPNFIIRQVFDQNYGGENYGSDPPNFLGAANTNC